MPRQRVSPELRKAKRRLTFVTPENADKVLGKDIYWTVSFLMVYLERCDELGFDDPKAGLALAVHAPQLAQTIGVGEREEEYRSTTQKASYEVQARAVLANLYRANGDYDAAEAEFQKGFEVLQSTRVVPSVRAQLLRRYGNFRECVGKPDAQQHLDEAVRLAEEVGVVETLAEILATRGYFFARRERWGRAADDLSKALSLCDPKSPRGERVIMSSIANLSCVIAKGPFGFGEREAALRRIAVLQKRFASRSPYMRNQLYWIEGLIHKSMCLWGPAIRRLEKARKAMQNLGEPADFVLISLDLAGVFLTIGKAEKVEQLRKETAAAFEDIATDDIDGLNQVRQALENWEEDTLDPLRTMVRQAVSYHVRRRHLGA